MASQKKEAKVRERISISDHLQKIGLPAMRKELLEGLQANPKYISSKFFYDDKGSHLFEKITALPEYYPSRTEKQILATLWEKLSVDADKLNTDKLNIIELGSGDSSKISLLLSQLSEDELSRTHYFPVDISHAAINSAANELINNFPTLEIHGLVADFIRQTDILPDIKNRLFCFFGSTLGNLEPGNRDYFIRQLGSIMNKGDHLLLGLDMVKDSAVLEKAYNDSQQVTAQFNKNVLNVTNNLLDANFKPELFNHIAFYNTSLHRIEMHLQAKQPMHIHYRFNGQRIDLSNEETIHTENSHKFNRQHIDSLARTGGLETNAIYTDPRQWFSISHFSK
ncbi:MAG: L-histidine N(alpha)-methyltransferase [Bacteroidota bacterium]